MEKKKLLKWEPTAMMKPPDKIISSDYPNWKPFIASYEQERRPDMAYLLGMEYARIWRRERDLYVPNTEPKDTTILPRKRIVKGLNKKKEKGNKKEQKPLFKMKKFENIPAKINENNAKDK